jgi:hypothetical protein
LHALLRKAYGSSESYWLRLSLFPPVGCVSLLIGVLNLLFAVDPRVKLEDPQYRWVADAAG